LRSSLRLDQYSGSDCMRFKSIEKLKFRITGRSVPVIKCMDIDENGRINSLHLIGECKDNQNTIHSTWDDKGWEKDQKTGGPILYIDEKGIKTLAYVVSESGTTVSLYTSKRDRPNAEDTIGKMLSWDVLTMALDMGKSLRNIMIGMVFGIALGSFFIGPILTAMMS
jgi:hypothetical protein